MKSKIGIGVIGSGSMGRIHAECYTRERGCKIIGFQNRSKEKAAELAKTFGGKVYDSVEDLLADPAIDAVSICTSQQVHKDQILAAARAGKDIFIEKPLALATAELDEIEKALAETKRVLMVGHQLRFHPVANWVRAQMPKIGPVYHLDLEWCFRIGGHAGRCWMDYRSGGFFMELGVHLADLARYFFGEIRHVSANTLRINPQRVTEDYTHCLLQFASHASGSLLVSANHRTERQGLLIGRLLGAKGRIRFKIYPYQRSLNNAVLTLDAGKTVFIPDTKQVRMRANFPPSLFKDYRGFFDVYQQEVHAFLDAVHQRAQPPVTFADGRSAVEVILAAYASQGAATERPNFNAFTYRADAACHPLLQLEASR